MTALDDLAAGRYGPSSNGATPGVAAIRRALFEDAQNTRDADGPARIEVPGTSGLLHRGVPVVLFSERGAGKSTVALTVDVSAAAAGEKVLYLDRENGAALTRVRVEGILAAHDAWPDVLASERWVGRHYAELGRWAPDDYAEAIAGLGFTVVTYDSWREFLTQLGLDPNADKDISAFIGLAVTPLTRRGLSVRLLDNVGHEHVDRPKNSGAKLDAIPQAYKVITTSRFSPLEVGAVRVTCTRSRYGDVGRDWTMRVGGGVFDLPQTATEAPDARRARRVQEGREKFREACIRALGEDAPQGRDRLIAGARERGAKGGTGTLRGWLAELAADPATGLVQGPDGYELTPGPESRGHSEATPWPLPVRGQGSGHPSVRPPLESCANGCSPTSPTTRTRTSRGSATPSPTTSRAPCSASSNGWSTTTA